MLLIAPTGQVTIDTDEIDEAVCARIIELHEIWRQSSKVPESIHDE
jgi:hypothetical protein